MKTNRIFIILAAVILASCFEDSGTDIVWGDKAYLEIDRAGQPNPTINTTITRINDGVGVPFSVQVNLAGRPQNNDVNVTFEIDAASTAVAGVHYNKITSGNNFSIPAGDNVANIEFEILDEGINPGEVWSLIVKLTGGDLPVSSSYDSAAWTIQVACPSDLGGTYSYSMTNIVGGSGYTTCSSPQTGTGTLTEQTANGVYSATDFTFGQFTCGYGDSPPAGTLGLNDLCDNLFMTGTDKYGDSYTITLVSVTATVLTFDWINTYGDGGRVAMTRTDAKTWPLGLNTN